MSRCDRIQRDAAGLVALPRGDPEHEEARTHASTCAECASALGAAERLHAALVEPDEPTSSPDMLVPALRSITAKLRSEARRRTFGAMLALVAAFAIAVGLARHRPESQSDRGLALALIATALASAPLAAARRWALPTTFVLFALSMMFAMGSGGDGTLQPELGIECLGTELACAGLVVAGTWLALRGGSSVLGPRASAGGAALGALGGMSALQVVCPAHGVMWHLLAFHASGTILAAAGAWFISSRASRTPHAVDTWS